VVQSQYLVGKVPQQDVLRVQTELSRLRDEENRLAQMRSSVAAALNRLTDHPPSRALSVTEALPERPVGALPEWLQQFAQAHNPELLEWERQIERDARAVELADLSYWPDFTVGAEWMRSEPRPAFEPPINLQTGARSTA
jgi:outer membrane protein TolC